MKYPEDGPFSQAGILVQFKENHGKRGFSWIRNVNERPPAFATFKKMVDGLVELRYLTVHGRPDSPRSNHYKVTSLGHRFIEQNKPTEAAKVPQPVFHGNPPVVRPGEHHSVPAPMPDRPLTSILMAEADDEAEDAEEFAAPELTPEQPSVLVEEPAEVAIAIVGADKAQPGGDVTVELMVASVTIPFEPDADISELQRYLEEGYRLSSVVIIVELNRTLYVLWKAK